MRDKYLLYIDILGFRELARTSQDRVYDLYRVVASLNVHMHSAFEAIVFSDTIVITTQRSQRANMSVHTT